MNDIPMSEEKIIEEPSQNFINTEEIYRKTDSYKIKYNISKVGEDFYYDHIEILEFNIQLIKEEFDKLNER